jgi:hypothetical protein
MRRLLLRDLRLLLLKMLWKIDVDGSCHWPCTSHTTKLCWIHMCHSVLHTRRHWLTTVVLREHCLARGLTLPLLLDHLLLHHLLLLMLELWVIRD